MRRFAIVYLAVQLPLLIIAQVSCNFKEPGTQQINNELLLITIRQTDSAYLFVENGNTVLKYNYMPASIPANTDQSFAKSGYIHPLNTPSGKTVTGIQPPDHLHHYGIWSAWTKTIFRGKQVDFWNLGQKTGRIDYAETISICNNHEYISLKVRHNHMALDSLLNLTPAIFETLEIRVFHKKESMYVVDYISAFECANDEGIVLEEYRYGGFVFRGNENWGPKSVNLITSEGKNQSDSDGERARWCLVTETGENNSGILMLSHPKNFNHPEPLRTWNKESNNGFGNIFVNFCPIRNRNWILQAGREYVMRYRIITFDFKMDVDMAEKLWKEYECSFQ